MFTFYWKLHGSDTERGKTCRLMPDPLLPSQEKANPYVAGSRGRRQDANAESRTSGLQAVATRVGVVATAAFREVRDADATTRSQ